MNVNVKATANTNAPCTKTENGVRCISSEGLGVLAMVTVGALITQRLFWRTFARSRCTK